jgi:hypothetical protein
MSTDKIEPIERSPALNDLLRGAREIASYAGETPSAIYHIVKTKKKPLADVIGKSGKELISFKSKIDRVLRDLAK